MIVFIVWVFHSFAKFLETSSRECLLELASLKVRGHMLGLGFILGVSSGLLQVCVSSILLDDENVISYSQRGVGRGLAAHCLHLIIC